MPFSLDIQPLLELRIASLEEYSRNHSATQGVGRVGVRAKHWIQYEGSAFTDPSSQGLGQPFIQDRRLRFAHFVEVQDVQRDYTGALEIHEALMAWLNGFFPKGVENIKGPLTLESDDLVNVASATSPPVYRYRARYSILVGAETRSESEPPFVLQKLMLGVWRSPINEVGNKDVSTKDADLLFETEAG